MMAHHLLPGDADMDTPAPRTVKVFQHVAPPTAAKVCAVELFSMYEESAHQHGLTPAVHLAMLVPFAAKTAEEQYGEARYWMTTARQAAGLDRTNAANSARECVRIGRAHRIMSSSALAALSLWAAITADASDEEETTHEWPCNCEACLEIQRSEYDHRRSEGGY